MTGTGGTVTFVVGGAGAIVVVVVLAGTSVVLVVVVVRDAAACKSAPAESALHDPDTNASDANASAPLRQEKCRPRMVPRVPSPEPDYSSVAQGNSSMRSGSSVAA